MKNFSIRSYVVWLTLIPMLVMAVGLEAYFLHSRAADLDRDLIERGKLIARQLASSSEYGVISNNHEYLRNIAQATFDEQDVIGIVILDAASESLIEVGSLVGSGTFAAPIKNTPEKNTPEKDTIDPTNPDNLLQPSLPRRLELGETNTQHLNSDIAASATAAAPAVASNNPAQARQERVAKVTELVGLHSPIINKGQSLWIYEAIIPVQVSLDELEVKPEAQQVGAVILEMSWVHTQYLKSKMLEWTIGATMLFLALTLWLVYCASNRITSPVRKLSDAVQQIGAGDLGTRVAVSHRISELNNLAYGINAMAGKLQLESERLHQKVEEATRIAAIAFESNEGMAITDAKGIIIRVNSAFSKITGYTESEAVGQAAGLLKSGEHDAHFYKAMWESINRTGSWHGEISNKHKNGEIFPAWLTITEVKKEDGQTTYYVATYTDITLRKAAENEIRNLAYIDALTHLPNRRLLVERLSQAMAASKRSGRYGAVMFLDLDNFKPLNDQFGHAVGDLLLIEVARRLVRCVREVDTVARFAGDEFIVLLSELSTDKADSVTQAGIIAEKVRDTLADPYVLDAAQNNVKDKMTIHHCTSSIGVAMFIDHDADPETVLKHADLAMYKAKREGRNTIRFDE